MRPHIAGGILSATLLTTSPALACNPCGCGAPGNAIEVSTPGLGTIRQAPPGSWVVSTGIGLRDVTGSFNDRGAWSARPAGSRLLTWQAQSSLTWFPTADWTVGVLLPAALNDLDRAQWSGQGSIKPVDPLDLEELGSSDTAPRQTGGGLSDVALRTSWIATPGDETWPAIAWWGNLTCPTGRGQGRAADQTGTGVFQIQTGLSAWQRCEAFELSGSLGASAPLGSATGIQNAAFFLGRSLLAQAQGSVDLSESWSLSLGTLAFRSAVDSPDVAPSAATMGKLKLVGSLEWRPASGWSMRASYGADPGPVPGLNAMTDQTFTFLTTRLL